MNQKTYESEDVKFMPYLWAMSESLVNENIKNPLYGFRPK